MESGEMPASRGDVFLSATVSAQDLARNLVRRSKILPLDSQKPEHDGEKLVSSVDVSQLAAVKVEEESCDIKNKIKMYPFESQKTDKVDVSHSATASAQGPSCSLDESIDTKPLDSQQIKDENVLEQDISESNETKDLIMPLDKMLEIVLERSDNGPEDADDNPSNAQNIEDRFECPECSARFKYKCWLTKHLRSHTGDKPHSCSQCSAKFPDIAKLTRHLRTAHSLERPFNCTYCDTSFKLKQGLIRHVKQCHEEPYACADCPSRFHLARELKIHVAQHNIEKKYLQAHSSKKFRGERLGLPVDLSQMAAVDVQDLPSNLDATVPSDSQQVDETIPEQISEPDQKTDPVTKELKIGLDCLDTGTESPNKQKPSSALKTENGFGCPHCSAQFKWKSHLTVHLRYHTGDMPYSCSMCPAKFAQMCNLKEHVATHSAERLFKCTLCVASFKSKPNLTRHIVYIHGDVERNVPCPHCSKKFRDKWELRSHMVKHSRGRSHACPLCPSAFKHKWHLTEHLKCHTKENPHSCQHCSAKFERLNSLKKHLKVHLNKKMYSCTHCPFTCGAKSMLVSHVLTHTVKDPNESLKSYSSEEFLEKCSLSPELKEHVVTVDSEDSLSTDQRREPTSEQNIAGPSQETDSVESKLKITLRHRDTGAKSSTKQKPSSALKTKKDFGCPYCEARFTFRTHLTIHIRCHTGGEAYSCSLCPAKFAQISNLKSHIASHSSERLFKCTLCTASFKTKGHLTRHLANIHGGIERVHSCTHCSKTFRDKWELDSHMVKHSSGRPHACPQCPMAFKRKSNLTNHLRCHTEENPFACQHCSAKFGSVINLGKHLKAHYAKEIKCKTKRGLAHRALAHTKKEANDSLVFYSGSHPQSPDLNQHSQTTDTENSVSFNPHPETIVKQEIDDCNETYDLPFKMLKVVLDRCDADTENITQDNAEQKTGKKFSCPHCPAKFKYTSWLSKHLSHHTMHACTECPAKFGQISSLKLHLTTHSEGRFACTQCGARFDRRHRLYEHIEKKHSDLPFVCPECPSRFRVARDLNVHVSQHKKEGEFSCKHCSKRFESKWNLKSHLVKHSSERPFPCLYCPKAFKRKSELILHLKHRHEGEKQFSSPPVKVEPNEHISVLVRQVKTEPEEMYSSSHCSQNSEVSEKNLTTAQCSGKSNADSSSHSNINSTQETFSCAQCSVKFVTESELFTHTIYSCHSRVNPDLQNWLDHIHTEKNSDSNSDDFAESSRGSLKTSLEIHSAKTYSENVSAECDTERELAPHVSIHEKSDSNSDTTAKSTSGSKLESSLKIHSTSETHSENFPAECSTKRELESHVTTHTEESSSVHRPQNSKMYVKKQAYTQYRQNLKPHSNLKMHPKEDYVCGQCSAKFHTMNELLTHKIYRCQTLVNPDLRSWLDRMD